MTQAAQILAHLKKGRTVTPLEAAMRFGCMCLAERIRDLRDDGHKIETTIIKANGKRFARYSLG